MLPPSLGALARVRNFTVSNNKLSGSLPAEMGAMENLRMFACSNAGLGGNVFEVVSKWIQAEALIMDNDEFTGEVPPLDTTWPHLSEFNFANNSLTLASGFCPPAAVPAPAPLPPSLDATSCLPDPQATRQGCCLEGNRGVNATSSPCASECLGGAPPAPTPAVPTPPPAPTSPPTTPTPAPPPTPPTPVSATYDCVVPGYHNDTYQVRKQAWAAHAHSHIHARKSPLTILHACRHIYW